MRRKEEMEEKEGSCHMKQEAGNIRISVRNLVEFLLRRGSGRNQLPGIDLDFPAESCFRLITRPFFLLEHAMDPGSLLHGGARKKASARLQGTSSQEKFHKAPH